MKLEWRDNPTMNPRNTRQLRPLIERRTVVYLWGQKRLITPRLVARVFGNGRALLALSPIKGDMTPAMARLLGAILNASAAQADILNLTAATSRPVLLNGSGR